MELRAKSGEEDPSFGYKGIPLEQPSNLGIQES